MARLTTSDPSRPGWARVRCGRGFRYRDATGAPIREPGRLARVKALVIPPAWTDVWICPEPGGHIQALGTDAAGRRQYLYHPDFRARQETAKHEHVLDVARRLPGLRDRVAADLELRGLQRDRVAACAARLLDLGFFRIGSPAYREANGSYGLTTLRRDQTRVRGATLHFAYPAKSGRERELTLTDPAAAAVVRGLHRRRDQDPGLWAHWEHRRWQRLTAPDLTGYLRERSGTEVTAKDFRTWHATVVAAVGLAVSWPQAHRSATARRRATARVVRETAAYLGNTPAVCLASYINPRLFELYDQGRTIADALPDLAPDSVAPTGLPGTGPATERAVLDLLTGP
ncbi:DNA topoisomerase [Kitasatospora sp. MMS16-BH015]|uniref:DNA topoisomerase IB n=1 Tax=Kitasatospora sp. MMS16-BH015 TaxID=2018025 RepID=UPI000CA2F65F|nr:DNA topoisomerase IB [Kitasatospora sp. MMS16-BH015]AUG81756.1 DNA topoisomerase [Kitasatospora sp. MMS16-BH015]